MANTEQDWVDLSESDWVGEVWKLGQWLGEKSLVVRVRWSFGCLIASGSRPEVSGRTLHILLQQQLQGDLHDGVLQISLPEREQGHYRKHESGSGEIVLTMFYPLGTPPDFVVDWTEVQLATNADFLFLVSSEVRVQ